MYVTVPTVWAPMRKFHSVQDMNESVDIDSRPRSSADRPLIDTSLPERPRLRREAAETLAAAEERLKKLCKGASVGS